MLFESGLIDGVGGSEAVLERVARSQITQFGLNHRAKVTGRMVAEIDDFAKLAFEKDDHTTADLCCRNCHTESYVSELKIIG